MIIGDRLKTLREAKNLSSRASLPARATMAWLEKLFFCKARTVSMDVVGIVRD